jgi:hypothetical protein
MIRMLFKDHSPAHFHARYGEVEATVDIATLEIIEGHLPSRALKLTQEWAMMHKRTVARKLAALPSEYTAGKDRAAPMSGE